MIPSSSPGNGGGGFSNTSSYGQRTPSRQNSSTSLGARISAQQPPPPQPNFQPVASTSSSAALRNSASNSSLKRKELHLPDINDPAAESPNKRLATPSSPFADASTTSTSSKPTHQRTSETPTRRTQLRGSSFQPNNAVAGPSHTVSGNTDVYVELPALSLSQPTPSSSPLTELAGSTAPQQQHPKSELDNFDSPVQSEYGSEEEEEEEEDGDEYMREGGDASGGGKKKSKGKGRERRGSLSGTPRGRIGGENGSPRKVGGDTGGRDARGESDRDFETRRGTRFRIANSFPSFFFVPPSLNLSPITFSSAPPTRRRRCQTQRTLRKHP